MKILQVVPSTHRVEALYRCDQHDDYAVMCERCCAWPVQAFALVKDNDGHTYVVAMVHTGDSATLERADGPDNFAGLRS